MTFDFINVIGYGFRVQGLFERNKEWTDSQFYFTFLGVLLTRNRSPGFKKVENTLPCETPNAVRMDPYLLTEIINKSKIKKLGQYCRWHE